MITSLVYLVIYVMVVGLICWLLLYLNDAIPIPEPFHNVVRIAVMVFGVIICIFLLLGMIEGSGVPKLRLG